MEDKNMPNRFMLNETSYHDMEPLNASFPKLKRGVLKKL